MLKMSLNFLFVRTNETLQPFEEAKESQHAKESAGGRGIGKGLLHRQDLLLCDERSQK